MLQVLRTGSRSLSGSILALVALRKYTVFARNSLLAEGQSAGASFHISNDGSAGSILGSGLKVHCYDNYGTNLPVATLLPTQTLYQKWPLVSYLDDIYTCDFELDAASGTLRQNFQV